MSLSKLIRRDLRRGLLRPRWLLVPVLAALPCWMCRRIAGIAGFSCGWGGYMLYCFMGAELPGGSGAAEAPQLPVMWLVLISGCLYLNLDYMLNDLSLTGQQIIVRSGDRREWFISKCVWNMCSCGVYFVLVSATAAVFALCAGGDLSLSCDAAALNILYRGEAEVRAVAPATVLAASVLIPYLTVSALSLIQMTLCLVMRPVLCFLLSEVALLASVYRASPLVLGNGAMGIRSGLLVLRGVDWRVAAWECVAVAVLCAVLGAWEFKRCDIICAKE